MAPRSALRRPSSKSQTGERDLQSWFCLSRTGHATSNRHSRPPPARATEDPAINKHHPPPRFASSKLKFGAFDVGVWPRAAMEAKLNTNTWSNQLPTVVLYEKGREWGRLPPAEAINNPSKPNNYTRVSRLCCCRPGTGRAGKDRGQAAWQLARGDRLTPTPSLTPIRLTPHHKLPSLTSCACSSWRSALRGRWMHLERRSRARPRAAETPKAARRAGGATPWASIGACEGPGSCMQPNPL
jgi:hypothetical protein